MSDRTTMDLLGCYSCTEVGGTFIEKVDGLIECGNCGEPTVISFKQALDMFMMLKELGLLDEYNELIEQFGVLKFDDDEFDLDDYE